MAVYQSLSLTQVSQDYANNTSQVRILWQSTQTGGSYNETERTASYTVSINGAEAVSHSVSYILPMQATVAIVDETVTVPHNDKGEASVTVTTWMNTNISAGVVELTKTLIPDPIPRASTLRASDGTVGGSTKIAIVKKNSGFSHSIAYRFGGLQGYVTAEGQLTGQEAVFSADSVELLLPEQFYEQIPDAKSGQCTLQLQTYDGDTPIGALQDAVFTVTAEEDVCRPRVSGTVVDTNQATLALTGDEKVLVRFMSDGHCTVSAEAQKGAQIVTKQIGGQTVSGDELVIAGIEQETVRFAITDSRGYTAEYTHACSMIPYIKLSAEAVAERENAGSQAMVYASGDCYSGSFGLEDNALTVAITVEGRDPVFAEVTVQENRYYAFAELTDVDYTRVYGVTVRVSDRLMTAEKQLTLKKAVPVFDWGENDFAFHVPVQMDSPLPLESGGTGCSNWDAPGVVVKAQDEAGLTSVTVAEGAFFAGEDGALQFAALPIRQGGTGANSVEKARENLELILPMLPDTEYATLERWCGQTVYTKLLDFGTMPNNAVKSIAHNTGATRILGCCGSTSGGRTLPYGGKHVYRADIFCDAENVYIDTEIDYSAYTATVQIWYIK